jgi:hypothetical protein
VCVVCGVLNIHFLAVLMRIYHVGLTDARAAPTCFLNGKLLTGMQEPCSCNPNSRLVAIDMGQKSRGDKFTEWFGVPFPQTQDVEMCDKHRRMVERHPKTLTCSVPKDHGSCGKKTNGRLMNSLHQTLWSLARKFTAICARCADSARRANPVMATRVVKPKQARNSSSRANRSMLENHVAVEALLCKPTSKQRSKKHEQLSATICANHLRAQSLREGSGKVLRVSVGNGGKPLSTVLVPQSQKHSQDKSSEGRRQANVVIKTVVDTVSFPVNAGEETKNAARSTSIRSFLNSDRIVRTLVLHDMAAYTVVKFTPAECVSIENVAGLTEYQMQKLGAIFKEKLGDNPFVNPHKQRKFNRSLQHNATLRRQKVNVAKGKKAGLYTLTWWSIDDPKQADSVSSLERQSGVAARDEKKESYPSIHG